jgi:hypothetical protein
MPETIPSGSICWAGRREGHAILRPRDDSIGANLSQILLACAHTLTNLIDRLIERPAILRIFESGDPGPVDSHVICCVAARKPGRTLIGTDAVADTREALEIGEIEAVRGIDSECGITASQVVGLPKVARSPGTRWKLWP